MKYALLSILAIGLIFLVIPKGYEARDYFLFADQKITIQQHVWFVFKHHYALLVLSYLLVKTSKSDLFKVFFLFQVLYFIDYMLTYNSVWFKVGSFPISANTVGILLFSIYLYGHGSRKYI